MAVGGSTGGAGFNNFNQQLVQAELGQWDPTNPSGLMEAAEHLPGFTQSAGVTGLRGSNTILGGGWSEHRMGSRSGGTRSNLAWRRGQAPRVGSMVKNNNLLRPRTWSRYGSQDIFFNKQGWGQGNYSPFGMGAGALNLGSKAVGGKALANLPDGAYGGDKNFYGGLYGQMSAAERVGGKGALSARKTASLEGYFAKARAAGLHIADDALDGPANRRKAVYMSMRGRGGQAFGGFMTGLRESQAFLTPGASAGFKAGANSAGHLLGGLGGLTGEQIGGKIGMRAGGTAIKSATKQAGVKAGAKVAGALALRGAAHFVPILNVAMLAWTAYDIAKMGGAAVKAAGRLATDAGRSFMGNSQTAIFGAAYHANDASVTSRQRGVAAIQNSRLNARSLLGSEAGGMAAHFG